MPATNSAAKRHRQNLKRRMRNRIYKTRIKTSSKIFEQSVNGESRGEAESKFQELTSLLDRAVSKGIYHRNTASRKKARLQKLLQKMS